MNEHCTPSGIRARSKRSNCPRPWAPTIPPTRCAAPCTSTARPPDSAPSATRSSRSPCCPSSTSSPTGASPRSSTTRPSSTATTPGRPLDPEIAALTGLTDEDLHGAHIDVQAASDLVSNSDLIIAHNARFDRPFFERALPATRRRALGLLDARRAVDRPWLPERRAALPGVPVRGLRPRPPPRPRRLRGGRCGCSLRPSPTPASVSSPRCARTPRRTPCVLWAAGAPFAIKHELKARGYRWMPQMQNRIERAWWTEVAPQMVGAELDWLREAVYDGEDLPHIPQRRVTARDRWRADPSDIAHRAPTTPAIGVPPAG